MQYLLQAARYIFPFITIPYLTRVLGPDSFAVRAYMISVMAFFMVVMDYGFTPYGTKRIADAFGKPERAEIENKMCGGITTLRLGLCALLVPLLLVMTMLVPIMSANPAYVALSFASTCLTALLPDFLFQGREDMGIITYRFVLTQSLSIICIFTLVHSPDELLLVPAFELGSSVIALAWSWENAIVKQKVRPKRMSVSELRDAVRVSTAFFASTASTTIIASLTTVVIGIVANDPADVSYWSIAMTAVVAVQSLYTPLAQSLYPHMCARKDFSLATRLLKIGIPVAIAGSIAFALLSGVIMWLVGGEEYMAGAYVIAMVAPVFVFSYPSQILGYPVLAAVGRIRQLTRSSLIAAAFNVLCLGILIAGGWFSIEAACAVRVATEALMCFLRVFFVLRWRRESVRS